MCVLLTVVGAGIGASASYSAGTSVTSVTGVPPDPPGPPGDSPPGNPPGDPPPGNPPGDPPPGNPPGDPPPGNPPGDPPPGNPPGDPPECDNGRPPPCGPPGNPPGDPPPDNPPPDRPPCWPDCDNDRPPCWPDCDDKRPPCWPDCDNDRPPCWPDCDNDRPPCWPDCDDNRPPKRDFRRPFVVDEFPRDGARSVRRFTDVAVLFSERVRGVDEDTFELFSARSRRPVFADVFRDGSREFVLDPRRRLARHTRYVVVLRGGFSGIRDFAGNRLTSVSWTFRTSR